MAMLENDLEQAMGDLASRLGFVQVKHMIIDMNWSEGLVPEVRIWMSYYPTDDNGKIIVGACNSINEMIASGRMVFKDDGHAETTEEETP